MKTLLASCTACLLWAFAAPAQEILGPHEISPRVGHEIDTSERTYFGLWLSQPEFEQARSFMSTDSSVIIELALRGSPSAPPALVRQKLSQLEAKSLRDYIERFELRLSTRDPIPLIRAEVMSRRADVLSSGWLKKDAKLATLKTRDGQNHVGYLLFATDSALVFWNGSLPYDWRNAKSATLLFKPAAIEVLKLKGKSQTGRGFGFGFLTGSALGALWGLSAGGDLVDPALTALAGAIIVGLPSGLMGSLVGAAQGVEQALVINGNLSTYASLMPRLRTEAYFALGLPPELHDFVEMERKGTARRAAPLVDTSLTKALPARTYPHAPPVQMSTIMDDERKRETGFSSSGYAANRVHLLLTGAFGGAAACGDMKKAFQGPGFAGSESFIWTITYPHEHPNSLSLSFGMSLNLEPHFRLGVERNLLPTQRVDGMHDQFEETRASSYGLGFEFVAKPVQRTLLPRSEVVLGAGFILTQIEVTGELRPSWSSRYFSNLNQATTFALSKRVSGIHVSGTSAYYLSKGTSLYFRFRYRFLRPVQVPGRSESFIRTYKNYSGQQITETETRTLPTHDLSYSGPELSLGLGLHF